MHVDCWKNPGVSSRTEQKLASSETPTGVTEARAERLYAGRTRVFSALLSSEPPAQAASLGAQNCLWNENPQEEVSGEEEEKCKGALSKAQASPKGTDTSGLQMLLRATLERTENSTDVSLTKWYEHVDLEKLIFKISPEKIFLKDQHELIFLTNIKTL